MCPEAGLDVVSAGERAYQIAAGEALAPLSRKPLGYQSCIATFAAESDPPLGIIPS
jgi:hypothetical protein